MNRAYPYQTEGVRALANSHAFLLADEPGLGKTMQAVLACQQIDATRILVCTTASSVLNWRKEFERWSDDDKYLLHVLSYGAVSRKDSKQVEDAARMRWDVLICDEAHALKSSVAQRTRQVYRRLAPAADYVWLLSGTPAPNHVGELWTHLRSLRPDLIPGPNGKPLSQRAFEDAFCHVAHTFFGRRVTGSKNTKLIRKRMLEGGFLLRRRKAEVLPELPALMFDEYPLPGGSAKMFSDTSLALDGLEGDELIRALRSETTELATERRLTGLAKVAVAVDHIQDALEGGVEKIIVFAHHREVMDGLAEGLYLYGVRRIDGSTSREDRERAVNAFQQDEDSRVFLGQISACGEAITLHAASDVVFVEAAWTPSVNVQAACRAHRIGQTRNVTARFLSLAGSIDEHIQKTLARKATELAELFD